MKAKSRPTRKKLPFGPNIVRAWFDTVFRYALRGLASERALLNRKTWTYRFHRKSLEYIAPLRDHLPDGAGENLEQFLSFFPAATSLIDNHDEGVEKLREACEMLHRAILRAQEFGTVFDKIASEAPVTLGSDLSRHFGAYSHEADFKGLLAEYLVNNAGELPPHYATAALWNHYRHQLTAILQNPALSQLRDRTTAAGAELLQGIEALSRRLRDTRSELSLEFDVPFSGQVVGVR